MDPLDRNGGTTTRAPLDRRSFLKLSSLAAVSSALVDLPTMAGPFTRGDFEKLVPADKKLSREWIQSLFERGDRAKYQKQELEKIGMPVGGICAGQLYLGGDGNLWHWDIFNRRIGTGAEHYAKPLTPQPVLEQGFALRVTADGHRQERSLNRSGWKEVSFTGEYPIGMVDYRDPECPVEVSMRAYSPFIPLNLEDSSLPATIFEFSVHNRGKSKVEVELGGWLQNGVCLHSGSTRDGLLQNRVVRGRDFLFMEACALELPKQAGTARPDIVFEDFEDGTYGRWQVKGEAFGKEPVEKGKIPDYQGDVGGQGKRVANSHASAPGGDVGSKDNAVGRLTSRSFTIERNFITFLVGGGSHQGRTCVNLLVEGKSVMTVTGNDHNRMRPVSWDVRAWAGKSAVLEVVDDQAGGWGNIGVDDFVFSDRPRVAPGPMAEEGDYGSLGLGLLRAQSGDFGFASISAEEVPGGLLSGSQGATDPMATKPLGQKLVGGLVRRWKLAPGKTSTVTFVLTWHFPNLKIDRLPPGRHYATRFNSARAVADYVSANYPRLKAETRLWHDTWYDSTLPYWFLDRTFLNVSILATSTCMRFSTGRFYAWEGVGCCEGTCGHVWQYAHAVARLFPELERITREKVDFGLALQPDGAIHFRGEFNNIPAIDAQAGTVLRALREHQMSKDNAFLQRNWPAVRRSLEWLMKKDADGDGLIETNQHNTLDTDWFGPVAWLSNLYHASLLAGEQMALEMADEAFTTRCRSLFEVGARSIVAQLFEDGYFINKPDRAHLDAINSGTGCHIDQVMGQSWAFQVGLARVLPEKETLSALRSLWRYNFTPDVAPYREAYKAGRWYAMPGEAGLLMCTFPRKDWDYAQAKGKGPEWAAGYFNECMNGFEYQVASHMIWEGMVMEGLAVTRAVHDRYHASRRNPWNEVECGDHYARSMASHGVFLAACGYENHGPKGHLGFAPRITPEDFRAPFTAPEGWGTYEQKRKPTVLAASISLKYGRLRLRTLSLQLPANSSGSSVRVVLNGKPVSAKLSVRGTRALVELSADLHLNAGHQLTVELPVV